MPIALRMIVRAAASAALLAVLAMPAAGRTIEAPSPNGTVRAILVGIDLYRNVRPLHGAVADAEDLSLSLRSVGAEDVTLLTNNAAHRDAVLAAVAEVTARAAPGDLVVLGIAGHGSSEPERVKGSKPSGRDEVYILAGFDTRLPGSRERIFGDEFKAMIRRLEDKGADVLFIADSCHAGGLTREVDPRSLDMTWREAPPYAIEEDDLAPISTVADALATDFDFKRLTFVAAVDDKSKSPEIRVPGIAKERGALSYAMARAFEGAADKDGDGRVSRRELFEYLRQTVYQFTEQRQNIFTASPPDLDHTAVFAFADAGTPVTSASATEPDPSAASNPQIEKADAAPPPIAVASLEPLPVLATISPALTPFQVVGRNEADLVFDPVRGEAIAGGDVVATGIAAADLPFVVDRMAALDALKTLSGKAPQTVRVTPTDALHRAGEKVGAAVSDLDGRHLVLFDIAGDGTMQFLYPLASDIEEANAGNFDLDLAVVKPFGSDMLVAVTSSDRLAGLQDFLKQNDRRRAAGSLARHLADLLPPDARVGFSILYTSAGDRP